MEEKNINNSSSEEAGEGGGELKEEKIKELRREVLAGIGELKKERKKQLTKAEKKRERAYEHGQVEEKLMPNIFLKLSRFFCCLVKRIKSKISK